MIRKLKFKYYTGKEKINGKNRLSGRVNDSLLFDTTVFRDEVNNYTNVVSDHLQEKGITFYSLSITSYKRLK